MLHISTLVCPNDMKLRWLPPHEPLRFCEKMLNLLFPTPPKPFDPFVTNFASSISRQNLSKAFTYITPSGRGGAGHCLKLRSWQGPPNINKVKWYEIVLAFKVSLFIQFIQSLQSLFILLRLILWLKCLPSSYIYKLSLYTCTMKLWMVFSSG